MLPPIVTPTPLTLDRPRALFFAVLVIASCFLIGLAVYDAFGVRHHHHHAHYGVRL